LAEADDAQGKCKRARINVAPFHVRAHARTYRLPYIFIFHFSF
jgi:hypothetical protein